MRAGGGERMAADGEPESDESMTHPNSHPARFLHRHAAGRGAFTLVEVVVVITLIVILSALLLFSIGPSVKAARTASDTAFARSLGVGVEQFNQQFGFLPPLVDDFGALPSSPGGPIERVTAPGQPFIRLKGDPMLPRNDAIGQAQFLRHEVVRPDGADQSTLRMSYFSLPFYLVGIAGENDTADPQLNARIDGVQGPGFTQPLADGTFTRSGTTHAPMINLSTLTERLPVTTVDKDRAFFDRQRRAVRYYRWQPTLHVAAGAVVPNVQVASPGTAPANDPTRAGQVRSYNAPTVFPLAERQRLVSGQLQSPESVMTLQQRAARYAVVFAGLDGLFGDETIATLRTALGLVGAAQIDDAEVRRRAAADNLVILEGGS